MTVWIGSDMTTLEGCMMMISGAGKGGGGRGRGEKVRVASDQC